ncbi:putative SERF-like protein [Phlebotomus argentipes]|uniref:putative SERF-like protein n=1 Tax=Phlebotomus argentipes TaxID=94469 RepID=UPI00289368DE|nr:putative SERF-like protein [Phlebotomus argentipes]
MTRGNQRDLARAKNLKKQNEKQKGRQTDGLTVEQRKQRDADLMREKQKKKDDTPTGGQSQASGSR